MPWMQGYPYYLLMGSVLSLYMGVSSYKHRNTPKTLFMDFNVACQRNLRGYGRRNPLPFLSGQAVLEKCSAGSAIFEHDIYLRGD